MKRPVVVVSLLVILTLWLLSITAYVVTETDEVLIIRLGAPIGVVQKPGLNFKVPTMDTVIYYDNRELLLQPPSEQVILGDQKRLEVQTYARYRIVDPLRFYQSLRTLDQANLQLGQLISSSLRKELGQVNLPTLLSSDRIAVVNKIQAEVLAKGKSMGVEFSEVRFLKANLPLETSQAIYERMQSERHREAKELRAQGAEWAQQIQSKADKDKLAIISEAQRTAKIARGQGDATANQILSEAFGHDAKFYRLYRSLQTYRQSLAESAPILFLSPDSAFLRDLKTGPDSAPRK
ncbi:protease modulator HflC [Rhodoferax sp.]|uniref:protease modulator HflC n=1 Tax=Rhodoferax sp. TaxID=50421 RepID=UPI00284CDB49|nr:protease modulator HflC [Rhodoferax sp.]MDR3368385.1 protease modulator HflC [Rhodoferax sp.]